MSEVVVNWDDLVAEAEENDDGSDGRIIAANVAQLRKNKGMSQSALAEAMREQGQTHWRQTTVSRVENARQQLTGADVFKLQKVLGNEVMAGTGMDMAFKMAYPKIRERASRDALAEAERALTEALDTIRKLRKLYEVAG